MPNVVLPVWSRGSVRRWQDLIAQPDHYAVPLGAYLRPVAHQGTTWLCSVLTPEEHSRHLVRLVPRLVSRQEL